MTRLGGIRARGIALALLGAIASAPASAAADPAGPPVLVRDTEEGQVYTTMAGMALYTFLMDSATPGKSKCGTTRYTMQNGRQFGQVPLPAAQTRRTCAEKWPPFLADADAKPTGDWSLITREDGARQWAYKGAPLYTSIRDRRPGELNGQIGFGNYSLWQPVKLPVDTPPGFKLIRREEGLVLATADGRPVYSRRGGRLQNAAANSLQTLQPLVAPGIGRVSGKWGIIDTAGIRQYAFEGSPLFAAAEGYSDADVAKEGGWSTVIYRRAAPLPAQLSTRTTLVGKVFTTHSGMTLYRFTCVETEVPDYLTCDDPGDAAVYWSALCGDAKECSRRWRPYTPGRLAKPSGDWTIEEVADPLFTDPAKTTSPPGSKMVKAWAYRGKPVYTFVDDELPGETMGHMINYFSRSMILVIPVPGPDLY